jgi:predicted deacetylase
VCGEIRGYEKTSAAVERCAMTTCTAALRASGAGVVLRVIEFDVEGFVEPRWKVFERRVVAADIHVTDRAHRYLRRGELAAMTISACFVTRKARGCRVVAALVT